MSSQAWGELDMEGIRDYSWHEHREDDSGTLPSVLCVVLRDGSRVFFEGEDAEDLYPVVADILHDIV